MMTALRNSTGFGDFNARIVATRLLSAALVDGMFFQSSGYGQGLGMPGNVVFAFEIPTD